MAIDSITETSLLRSIVRAAIEEVSNNPSFDKVHIDYISTLMENDKLSYASDVVEVLRAEGKRYETA